MAGLGATRWVMPTEMKREDLGVLQREKPEGLETEVFAMGRLPLAFSARCFTARHANLPKDDCGFSCIAHPDGSPCAREDQPFLVLNGIQTQSARVYSLLQDLCELVTAGVDVLRLSPQSQNMARPSAVRRARNGDMTGTQAQEKLRALLPGEDCNGYWHGRPGLEQVREVAHEPDLARCPSARPAGLAAGEAAGLPGSLLLSTALNAGLAPHLPADVAQLMTGRKFRIHVRDARWPSTSPGPAALRAAAAAGADRPDDQRQRPRLPAHGAPKRIRTRCSSAAG